MADKRKEIIERAIYFDFEGLKGQPPIMAGILCEKKFEQVVFDAAFEAAAKAWRLRFEPLAREIKRLQKRCLDEQRLLICYSEFELNQISRHCGIDVSDVYLNALPYARRWKNRFHRDELIEDWGLKSFFRLINYRVPDHLGEGNAAVRLRYVRDQLAAKNCKFRSISDGAKEKWRLLLEYNGYDCRGLHKLITKVSNARWDGTFTLEPNAKPRSKALKD